jgi:heme-degrading monooxygenase HmoA
MPTYIAIRTYKLKPEVDKGTFEQAFENVKAAMGLQKVVLLKGYQGDQRVAKGDVDYISLHTYESAEACAEFFKPAYESTDEAEILSKYPDELRTFLQTMGRAHQGETAESTIFGYTVICGAV